MENAELVATELVIENTIASGCTQKDVAALYAMAMMSSWRTDWARVNAAIVAKWPKGLERVKRMAWKHVEERRRFAAELREPSE